MTDDAFARNNHNEHTAIERGAFVLRGFALPYVHELLTDITGLQKRSPFRHFATPGGFTMSSASTTCFQLGWTTIERSRERGDPEESCATIPGVFKRLARDAAVAAGIEDFEADACLVNRSSPGARLSLHQEMNSRAADAPIVALTLGMASAFLFRFRACETADSTARITLWHGDVVVWRPMPRDS